MEFRATYCKQMVKKKPSSNQYSIVIFITIQSFTSLLQMVEVEIENHSSSSNRRRGFGHRSTFHQVKYHLSPLYLWSDLISILLVVDLIQFVRDRVIREGKTSDFGRRHKFP
jgi:hypothetical protein